jgi:ferredoxin
LILALINIFKQGGSNMSKGLWQKTSQIIVNAGQFPIPISDTVIEIMQTIMNEEQAKFIQIFTKPMNMDELKETTKLDEAVLNKLLESLMHEGVITGIPSKRTGIKIYRLMPPLPGLLEYTMMRGETTAKQKKLATLFDRLFKEMSGVFQDQYDDFVELAKMFKPLTRVIPVEGQIKEEVDHILPMEDVNQVIEKFDTIAVAHCYCRHEKSLLGKECKVTNDKENCLFFGQTARFVIEYNFGREITKQEAREIIKKTEADGLVHKTFHEKQDIEKDEYAICNCCKCCCGTFEMFYKGAMPTHTYASYIASVNLEECTQCEACVDICPMEAIGLEDEIMIDKDKCIGCGVCASNCPVDAISLDRTGKREVFVAPKKLDA